jgi:hypothetical protein
MLPSSGDVDDTVLEDRLQLDLNVQDLFALIYIPL